MVPSPPGKKMYAVWSDSLLRTPQSTSATLRDERNLQKTALSEGRYEAVRTVVPASRDILMPPAGALIDCAPTRMHK